MTPTKWVRVWSERLPHIPLTLSAIPAAEAAEALRSGAADAGLVRLPIDRTGLSAIPLYQEVPVVVVPKDHLVTAVDEVSVADLVEEVVLHPLDDTLAWDRRPGLPARSRPASTAEAVELVAAGVGVLIVPKSLARLHHRKDVTYRTVTDAPESPIALSWAEERTTELVQEFIGIVRGRTVNSSRGRTPTSTQPKKTERPREADTHQKQGAGSRSAGRNTRGGYGGPRKSVRGKPRRRS